MGGGGLLVVANGSPQDEEFLAGSRKDVLLAIGKQQGQFSRVERHFTFTRDFDLLVAANHGRFRADHVGDSQLRRGFEWLWGSGRLCTGKSRQKAKNQTFTHGFASSG